MIEMLDDNQLVEMVQHGDYRGFSELWKRYEKFVYSVLDGKHLLAYPNWRDDMLAEGKRGFSQLSSISIAVGAVDSPHTPTIGF